MIWGIIGFLLGFLVCYLWCKHYHWITFLDEIAEDIPDDFEDWLDE